MNQLRLLSSATAFMLLALLFIGALFGSTASAHDMVQEQDHISVVGVGEVELEPDQATMNISITAKEATLPEAKKVADERYKSVLSVILDAGIDKKHVKATRISAQPQYEWQHNKQVYKGELVSRSLSIVINDLDLVSPLMQALVENGVSTIDGVSTGFQNSKLLQTQALKAAAEDAKSKAKFLAEQLGRKLGAAYLITEHNADAPEMVNRDRGMMASAMKSNDLPPPEMFGTQKVRAQINVSFNLL